MLRIIFTGLIAAHALLHTLGFLKAFGFVRLDQLKQPISRPLGLLWLLAAILLLSALALLFTAPRWFWLVASAGLVASQLVILSSWEDARFGTSANVVLLAGVIYGAFAWGPLGLRAEYERLVNAGLARGATAAPSRAITEPELGALPPPVQRYLRFARVVGTPHVRGFRARMTGRIRGSATAPWMPLAVEQHNFFDPPRRYFWMKATRFGLPIDGLHAYGESDATMRIRLLSLAPVVNLGGPALTRTETVTVLNDMCILAPGSLVDSSIRWRELDKHSVEATYTNGPHTVRAVLVFEDSGALVNFWSDDRPSLADDGKTTVAQRWSTPIREYRAMGPHRLASRGEGRYAPPDGEYAYIELDEIEVTTEIW